MSLLQTFTGTSEIMNGDRQVRELVLGQAQRGTWGTSRGRLAKGPGGGRILKVGLAQAQKPHPPRPGLALGPRAPQLMSLCILLPPSFWLHSTLHKMLGSTGSTAGFMQGAGRGGEGFCPEMFSSSERTVTQPMVSVFSWHQQLPVEGPAYVRGLCCPTESRGATEVPTPVFLLRPRVHRGVGERVWMEAQGCTQTPSPCERQATQGMDTVAHLRAPAPSPAQLGAAARKPSLPSPSAPPRGPTGPGALPSTDHTNMFITCSPSSSFVRVCAYVHTHMHTRTHICTHMNMHTHARAHAHTQCIHSTHLHTMHTCAHTYAIHTRAHMCIHTYTNTHTT